MRVRMNRFMASLTAGVDLEGTGTGVDDVTWPPAVAEVIEGGWLVRPSGAVVLAGIVRDFFQDEGDYYDLTAYEAAVNQLYVPDDGIDLSAEDALRTIAVRGYALVHTLLGRAQALSERAGPLLGVVNVGVWYEGKPGGNTHIHAVHPGESPWVRLDDLDGYEDEGMLVLEVA